MAVMTSFNFIGDVYCGSNPDLLNDVLRGEWGGQGMVLTDDVVRNGGDLMLGFLQHESNQLTDRNFTTLVKAMRQTAKNIFFTIVNSGAYPPQYRRYRSQPHGQNLHCRRCGRPCGGGCS